MTGRDPHTVQDYWHAKPPARADHITSERIDSALRDERNARLRGAHALAYDPPVERPLSVWAFLAVAAMLLFVVAALFGLVHL